MNITCTQNLSYNPCFGIKFFNKVKNPLTIIKLPSSPRKRDFVQGLSIYTKDELRADRAKYIKRQAEFRKQQKEKARNKTFIISWGLFSAILLSASVFAIARNTKLVTNVMNKYSSFRETKGIKDSSIYVSGLAGEPLKKANDKLALGVSNLCEKAKKINFKEKERVLKECADEGIVLEF